MSTPDDQLTAIVQAILERQLYMSTDLASKGYSKRYPIYVSDIDGLTLVRAQNSQQAARQLVHRLRQDLGHTDQDQPRS